MYVQDGGWFVMMGVVMRIGGLLCDGGWFMMVDGL